MKKIILYLFGLALLISSCKKDDPISEEDATYNPPVPSPFVPDNSFKIVAYAPYYADPALIVDRKYKMITHLFYAFLAPNRNADGSLQALLQPARFATFKAKAKANNLKFGISIGRAGGVTEGTYLAIASSATARANFVKNVVNFAKYNELEGVDMDWEYPRNDDGGSQAFHLLMKELSTELHKEGKFLSAAVTPAVYVSTNRDAILQETFQYMDFVNIMQYDGAGYDTAEPLNHAPYKMSVNSLNYWLDTRGLPKEKAIVGIPCYGKGGVAAISFKNIELADVANVNVNEATINGVTYGYNGIPTVKEKTKLAKERANGIMFWEFAQDSNTENSLIRAANDQLGRTY